MTTREHASNLAASVSPARFMDTLKEIIQIPYHSGQEEEITAWLANRLLDIGLQQVNTDGCHNVLGQLINGPQRLLLVAHRNIQAPSPNMPAPFTPVIHEVDGDIAVYGLGVASSKACIASMIEVLHVLAAARSPHLPTILFASHPGSFSSGNCGILDLFKQHDLQAGGAIVGEPTQLELGLGARGYTHIQLVFRGKVHHAGRPDNRLNPISGAAAFLKLVQAHPLPSHPHLGPASLTPIEVRSDGRRPQTPESAALLLDRRILPGEPGLADIIKQYRQWAEAVSGSLDVEVSVLRHQYPFEVAPDEPVAAALAEGLRLVTGKAPKTRTLHFSCGAGTVKEVGKITPVAFAANDVGYLGSEEHVLLGPNIIASRAMAAATVFFSHI